MSDPASKEAKRLAFLARLKGEVAPAEQPPTKGQKPASTGKGQTLQKTDFQAMTSDSAGKTIPGFSGRVKTETVKRIGEVVDDHPDKALAIFRHWMSQ